MGQVARSKGRSSDLYGLRAELAGVAPVEAEPETAPPEQEPPSTFDLEPEPAAPHGDLALEVERRALELTRREEALATREAELESARLAQSAAGEAEADVAGARAR